MPHEDMLTINQVGHRIGRSRWAVLRYIQEGKLASIQVGGQGLHLIDRAELDRFIEAEKAAALARFDEAAS
jgi:excisionase family DNA binding protein